MAINRINDIEIDGIPDGWIIVAVGERFRFKNGLNKAKEFFGHGTPIINFMDVFEHVGITNELIDGKVTLSIEERDNYSVRLGDVLFTRTSEIPEEIGMSSVLLENIPDIVFSGFVLRARPKDNSIDNEFKKYCFRSSIVRKQIVSTCSYTTRALTNGRLLSNIRFPLPPLPEQKAIAEVLSDTDNLIQSLEKQIAKKRLIKQGAMQKLLSEEGSRTLGSVCNIQKGQMLTSATKSDGSIPVIAGGKKPAYYHNVANRTGKTITISASGANAGYVSFHNYPIYASDCSTIGETDRYIIEFIYYLLQFKQETIYKSQTGGAQPHIHPRDLEPIMMPFPELNEQTRISTLLSDMDSEVYQLEMKLKKYIKIKNGLMQTLLTGKIRL